MWAIQKQKGDVADFRIIRNSTGFSDFNGTQHSAAVLTRWSSAELRQIGVYPANQGDIINLESHRLIGYAYLLDDGVVTVHEVGEYDGDLERNKKIEKVHNIAERLVDEATSENPQEKMADLAKAVFIIAQKSGLIDDPDLAPLLAKYAKVAQIRLVEENLVLQLQEDSTIDITEDWPTV